MVGVEQTINGAVTSGSNVNSLSTHFVVIRSSTVGISVKFNYLDNANSMGKSVNNNFELNKSTGALIDSRVLSRPGYRYQVSEVRKNR